MSIWRKISFDEAVSFFRIPIEVAKVAENSFYSKPFNPFDSDGPWPLIILLSNEEIPGIISLQLCSVFPEALEYPNFNPLTDPGGFITLDRESLTELNGLLNGIREQLVHGEKGTKRIFKVLSKQKLEEFRLNPDLFPSSRIEYYYQSRDPLAKLSDFQTETILIFSTGRRNIHPAELFFQILHFRNDALDDNEFNPMDHSLAKVNLDNDGLSEIISLLQNLHSRII